MITGSAAAILAVYPVLRLIASGSVLGVLLGFLIAMPLERWKGHPDRHACCSREVGGDEPAATQAQVAVTASDKP